MRLFSKRKEKKDSSSSGEFALTGENLRLMDIITTTKEHYLYPCTIFVDKEPYRITTVLGSCVSVCLWDPALKIGGMNHYMLPLWNGDGLASPKFGNIAISKLIEKMLLLGSSQKDLKAKIFGGGAVLRTPSGIMNVGERNVTFARDALREEGIPIISSDVGGSKGRKIIFNTGNGGVMMKKLRSQINDIKI
jgi:chemotaxis protein CheD